MWLNTNLVNIFPINRVCLPGDERRQLLMEDELQEKTDDDQNRLESNSDHEDEVHSSKTVECRRAPYSGR